MKEYPSVVTKRECVQTMDYMVSRPIKGRERLFVQGRGAKSGYVVIANHKNEKIESDCEAINSGHMVSKASAAYSGTPYTITTIRYMK